MMGEPTGRHWLPAVVAVVVLLAGSACDQTKLSTYYERGVVASAAPVASDIGAAIMEGGGNAYDAAVAVAFALAVVHPEAGNIGGGGFALIRDAATREIRALDFRETAPAAATETMYLDQNGEVVAGSSTLGALAVGVPGTVAGLYQMWQQYGSLPWDSLLSPAIGLADTGFVVDTHLAQSLADYRDGLSRFESTARQFLQLGRVPRSGELLVQDDLEITLRAIAENGPAGFYTGDVADKIVASMEAHGGLITLSDLAGYESQWRRPFRIKFDSLLIYTMPPPSSGGVCLGQILTMVSAFELGRYDALSPQYIHLFCEASRLAFADRSQHLGDPSFYNIPIELLDTVYWARRGKLIDSLKATPSEQVHPGVFGPSESDQTTHFSIADAAGNLVSLTYTLNTAYGSKLVVDGAGFLLNNEMDDFSIKPGHPNVYGLIGGEANRIEPGKRMLSSMSPTIVMRRDRPLLVLGSPGGSKIITVVAQAIINFSRFGMSVNQIAAQPRFHHQWLPDILYLERGGYDATIRQKLEQMGHSPQERDLYGDLQIIHITDIGLMTAASDPRGGGQVSGY